MKFENYYKFSDFLNIHENRYPFGMSMYIIHSMVYNVFYSVQHFLPSTLEMSLLSSLHMIVTSDLFSGM